MLIVILNWVGTSHNRCRTLTKHKMRAPSRKPYGSQQRKPFFSSLFSDLTRCQNRFRSGGELFRISTQGNNVFFPVKRGDNGNNYFQMNSPIKVIFSKSNGKTLIFNWKIINKYVEKHQIYFCVCFCVKVSFPKP